MIIADILSFLDSEAIPYTFIGDSGLAVDGFSSLSHYRPGRFTWVKSQKNVPEGFDLGQIALLFAAEDVDTGAARNVIRTAQSKRAFFSTIQHFYEEAESRPAIGQFSYIGPKVKLGKNVRIGHNCTLDGEITIGDDTVIWNNVVIINRVSIGKRCDIYSGTVIGHDGFGYTETSDYKKTMVKHFGGVWIGDDVSIRENCSISRGTIDDTYIDSGTKIDAQVRVGHNNVIEDNCAVIGGAILYGSCHLKSHSYIATSLIKNQVCIHEGGFVGMGAVVLKDVPPGETVVGNPAKPFMKKKA